MWHGIFLSPHPELGDFHARSPRLTPWNYPLSLLRSYFLDFCGIQILICAHSYLPIQIGSCDSEKSGFRFAGLNQSPGPARGSRD
jgi:hypothetical protein